MVVLAGCKSRAHHLATLTTAEGPVEREAGDGPWRPAKVGTGFDLGDAARTAAGEARLRLAGTAQQILMKPRTILRFGGRAGSTKVNVELGAIDLVGAGHFGLEVGDVELTSTGSIRVTARGAGKTAVELTVGQAQLVTGDGHVVALEVGHALELGIGAVEVTPVADAAVDAAPPDAAADAAAETSAAVQIEITGRQATVQLPGAKRWTALPAGTATIERGAKLRLGRGTTAKLTAHATTLEVGAGARLVVRDELILGLERGTGTASVPDGARGTVGVPGGTVELDAPTTGPARARIDVDARGTAKVTVLRGGVQLAGGNDATLAMNRGESAAVARGGALHPLDAIPRYYDLRVTVGDPATFWIHDPRGATAVRFEFGGQCSGGGVIEVDRDRRFRAARVSAGKDAANVMLASGSWAYRLRCTTGAAEGRPVASGRVIVKRDSGKRPLPRDPPINKIDADGRTYRVSYQSLIPTIKVAYRGQGRRFTLHLATRGGAQTVSSSTPTFTVPGHELEEGTYTYWVDHDGVKQDRPSTLIINFDQTAPQVYIEAPVDGRRFPAEVEVRGAVLPGWAAQVTGVEVPVDAHTRRFHARVPAPTGARAIAIRLSHPRRGVHFYLRRGGS